VLDVLRKKKQSFVINGLLLVIIGVFVFWGIGTGIADRVEVVATVNGENISRTELDRVSENLARSFREMSPNAAFPPELLRSQALDQLITATLFRQEAQKLGLQATDEELRDAITRIPVFQVDGRFSKEQYLRTLQANRRSPGEFEEAQREQVLNTKLQDLITAGAHVSSTEVRERYRHDNERVNLRYVKVSADSFAPSITPTDAEIEAYYNANKETFREPERARIEYVLFAAKALGAQITPSDEDIQARYDANPDDYRKPEEVHARHILFKIPPNGTPEQKDAARAQATDVLKQLEAGGDFAALAQQHSQDGTASSGGDLGWFGRGRMVPQFEQAAFTLAPGSLSNIVETQFGFHIIKVEEKRPEGVESVAEARPKIISAIQNERGREAALQAAEAAHDRLMDGTNLQALAAEGKLTIQTPPPFAATESIPGLADDREMVKQVYETAVGEVGEIATVDPGYVVFRVVERLDSAVPELAAIRLRVEGAVRTERSRAQAKEKAEALLKRLQESKDLDALAGAEGLKVEETGPVGRRGAYVPGLGNVSALKNDAFVLTAESPIAPAVYATESDSVIAVLKERMPADEAAFAEQEKQLGAQTRRQVEVTVMQQFVNHLKSKAAIDIDPSYGGTVGG
jgi:peptidyl-prolyl cis-trans isomerase D